MLTHDLSVIFVQRAKHHVRENVQRIYFYYKNVKYRSTVSNDPVSKILQVATEFAHRGNAASAFWGHLINLNIINSSTYLDLLWFFD